MLALSGCTSEFICVKAVPVATTPEVSAIDRLLPLCHATYQCLFCIAVLLFDILMQRVQTQRSRCGLCICLDICQAIDILCPCAERSGIANIPPKLSCSHRQPAAMPLANHHQASAFLLLLHVPNLHKCFSSAVFRASSSTCGMPQSDQCAVLLQLLHCRLHRQL